MSKKDEYDWLDDPFNDKKVPRGGEGMGKGTKLALGCGCFAVVAILVALVALMGLGAINILEGR